MTRDMTTGNPAGKLIAFSVPLLVGTVFQQLYSMVDSIIVGQYVGKQAFAAVGSTGSITFFVLGLVFGACSGFAIPVAQDFGAGDGAGVRRCVGNIVVVGVLIGLVLTLLTAPFTRQILRAMDTQEAMLQDAYDYLFWIFLGMGAQMLYNVLSGILRSLGDSRTPLYFLILSSGLNIALDLIFIRAFHMGVKGASIATVLSQLVSGLACLVTIRLRFPILRLTKRDLTPHMPTIRRLMGIGLPMGLQFSITAIGSLLLQRSINALDADAIASVAAAVRVQGLVVSPMDAFGVTMATFAGQNYGAKKIDRVKIGVKQVYWMLVGYSLLALTINVFLSPALIRMFIDGSEAQVIAQARHFLIVNGCAYPLVALIYVLRNTLQGVGFSKVAMLAGAFEMVARIFMSIFIVPYFGFNGVCFANPLAWFMADAILIPLYIVFMRRLARMDQPISM